MILLLIIMAVVVAVPVTVEAYRRPDDNLARDTVHELNEAIVIPVRNLILEQRLRAEMQVRKQTWKRFTEFLKSLWALIVSLFRSSTIRS